MKLFNHIFQNKNKNKNKKLVDNLDQNFISDKYSEIGRLVKEGRLEKNLSIQRLSEVSKIPESTLIAIENNVKDVRPKYPFIRSILLKLEFCLSLRKDSLVGLSIKETSTLKKDKKKFIIRKYDFINSWQGSIAYFIFLILIIFFLNRYFISYKSIIELQIIEKKVNKN